MALIREKITETDLNRSNQGNSSHLSGKYGARKFMKTYYPKSFP